MQELDNIYKIAEVAHWMKCSRASVYRILKSGALKSIKIGGARMVTHSQILDYLEARKLAE